MRRRPPGPSTGFPKLAHAPTPPILQFTIDYAASQAGFNGGPGPVPETDDESILDRLVESDSAAIVAGPGYAAEKGSPVCAQQELRPRFRNISAHQSSPSQAEVFNDD